MTRLVGKSEVDRLGKRGSYRLGSLGPLGVARPEPPRPFRPSFARPQHAGPASAWILAGVVGMAVIAVAAAFGVWFMPFVVGVVTGVAMRWGGWRLRVTVPAMVLVAALGWGIALWVTTLRGHPVGATARTIAALAGLPAFAAAAIGLTLAVSVVQALAGLWLGRAIASRPARD